jgi:hypothetical protein
MRGRIVLGVLVSALLLLAATAQAGTNRAEGDVAGSRPTSGLYTHDIKTPLRGKRFQSLYSSTFLDSVEYGISGWTLSTVLEDDPVEWASVFGVDSNVLGFVCITDVDPNHWCYHRVFIGPVPTVTFLAWFNNQPVTYWDAAAAVMTVTHESLHYRLYSADEGRVNACALQQFPTVISTYFGFSPTITKTVPVKKVKWKWKWVWARKHGKRVKVRKRVRRVVTVYVQKTFANPDYTNLVGAAQAFYRSQPPPYNTGTCY